MLLNESKKMREFRSSRIILDKKVALPQNLSGKRGLKALNQCVFLDADNRH
jgi:hypothetical protein